jgi:uncharacterized membrane protein
MEHLIGWLLVVGVAISMLSIGVGLLWHWAQDPGSGLDYTIAGSTLYQFVVGDVKSLVIAGPDPRGLINLGIAVLLLTPFARVLASMLYFALAERNRKYTLFTAFVLVVLSYSLFIR